jgi:hypothetical protein
MRPKILLLAASLLAATPAFATPPPPGKYDRAIARAQLESLSRAAEQQGKISAAQGLRFRTMIAAQPAKIDQLAEIIGSEGVDIGLPGSNLTGAAMIDSIVARMHDGRGAMEAAISTGGPARVAVTPGSLSSILPPSPVSVAIRTPEAPGVRSTSSSSMAGNIFGDIWNYFFGDDEEADKNRKTADEAAKRYKAEEEKAAKDKEAKEGKAAKTCTDTDEDPNCGMPVVSTGGSNGAGRPDPTGETRAKPSQLSPAEIASGLGNKQGQVTNPTPDGAGSGNFSGGTGAIPATRGGGVSNPGTAPVTSGFTTLPAKTLPAAPQVVDPARGDDPAKPDASGKPGQPSTPKPSQPGGG